jgi:hypothetical protein
LLRCGKPALLLQPNITPLTKPSHPRLVGVVQANYSCKSNLDNPERVAMNTQAWMRNRSAPRRIARPHCPHCNDMLVAPAVSVHVHQDDIRHWWSCDECGHEFMTAVTVATMQTEQFSAMA